MTLMKFINKTNHSFGTDYKQGEDVEQSSSNKNALYDDVVKIGKKFATSFLNLKKRLKPVS